MASLGEQEQPPLQRWGLGVDIQWHPGRVGMGLHCRDGGWEWIFNGILGEQERVSIVLGR